MLNKIKLGVVILSGAGTRFALPLLQAGYDIAGVIETGSDTKNAGFWKTVVKKICCLCRTGKLGRSLQNICRKRNIPHIDLDDCGWEQVSGWLRQRQPDVLVVYRAPILGKEILEIPKKGALNIHPSLLPKYRGGHPILWMHASMDLEGGVTVHFLDDGIDTGDIIRQKGFPIKPGMTEDEVEQVAAYEYGIPLLQEALDDIASDSCERIPQPKQSPTPVARRIKDEDYWKMIDWDNWSLEHTWHFLRCTPRWQSRLPAEIQTAARIYEIDGTQQKRNIADIGAIKQDGQGLFFVHSEGNIRIRARLSLVKLAKKIKVNNRVQR